MPFRVQFVNLLWVENLHGLGDRLSNKLLKSTSVVSSMTMTSRLLGFARDMVFAYIFGAHGGFDA
ncbi:MAG: hypothetical protein KDH94_06620, partial [Coxiellaceae bacterium]|nr:hypothetical protein [Coxiellaceae bacterium]